MEKKKNGNTAFYTALAVCLLAMLAGGYGLIRHSRHISPATLAPKEDETYTALAPSTLPTTTVIEDEQTEEESEKNTDGSMEVNATNDTKIDTTANTQSPTESKKTDTQTAAGNNTETNARISAASHKVDVEQSTTETDARVEEQTEVAVMETVLFEDDMPIEAEEPMLIVQPVDGEVIAAFSVEELTYNETLEDWRVHDGIDIQAEAGTAVLAACAGQVTEVKEDPLMGTTVIMTHDNGYQTMYASLESPAIVETGEYIAAGQMLGTVGDTAKAETAQGAHLHFSVKRDETSINPSEFLD